MAELYLARREREERGERIKETEGSREKREKKRKGDRERERQRNWELGIEMAPGGLERWLGS